MDNKDWETLRQLTLNRHALCSWEREAVKAVMDEVLRLQKWIEEREVARLSVVEEEKARKSSRAV